MDVLFSNPAMIAYLALLCILVIVFLISATHKPPEVEKLRHGKLRMNVFFLLHECGDIKWKEKDQPRRVPIRSELHLKNPAVHLKLKERVDKTPINTVIRITNYAWEIVEDLEFCRLLPPGWEPVAAFHFINGVCVIRYMRIVKEGEEPDSSYKDLYISTADGHVIYIKGSG